MIFSPYLSKQKKNIFEYLTFFIKINTMKVAQTYILDLCQKICVKIKMKNEGVQ